MNGGAGLLTLSSYNTSMFPSVSSYCSPYRCGPCADQLTIRSSFRCRLLCFSRFLFYNSAIPQKGKYGGCGSFDRSEHVCRGVSAEMRRSDSVTTVCLFVLRFERHFCWFFNLFLFGCAKMIVFGIRTVSLAETKW